MRPVNIPFDHDIWTQDLDPSIEQRKRRKRAALERDTLLAKRDRRLTGDGVFVVNAQRFRTQERNREDARVRLAAFVASGLHAPTPRIPTRPTRASKQRRLDAKRGRSTIKQGRTQRDWD